MKTAQKRDPRFGGTALRSDFCGQASDALLQRGAIIAGAAVREAAEGCKHRSRPQTEPGTVRGSVLSVVFQKRYCTLCSGGVILFGTLFEWLHHFHEAWLLLGWYTRLLGGGGGIGTLSLQNSQWGAIGPNTAGFRTVKTGIAQKGIKHL